ncbi:hypothetical protein BGLA2_170015 [Burkholderia gladioli]|nr:hypothetical protein BGLA2_170015 [Burkholderia gladioli]
MKFSYNTKLIHHYDGSKQIHLIHHIPNRKNLFYKNNSLRKWRHRIIVLNMQRIYKTFIPSPVRKIFH